MNGSCLVKTILVIREKIVRFKRLKVMGVEERFKDFGDIRNQSSRMIFGRTKTVAHL